MEAPVKKERVRRITLDDLLLLGSYEHKNGLLHKLNRSSFGFERFLINRDYCSSNEAEYYKIIGTVVQIICEACRGNLSNSKGALVKFVRMLNGCKQFIFNDVLMAITFLLTKKSDKLVILTSQYLIILQTILRHIKSNEIVEEVLPAVQNFHNEMMTMRLKHLDDVKIQLDKLKQLADRYEEPFDESDIDDEAEIANFREMSIVPQEDDVVNCAKPNLPQNIIDGPYKSVDHYLGVHFRLMREDMLRSFREIINNCLQYDEKAISRSSNRKYDNVYARIPPEYTPRGICYSIEVKSSTPLNWARKEILMPGALVCLTPNNFKKVVFATIVNDPKAKKGTSKECVLPIRLEDDTYNDILLPDQKYLMVEPNAYFECYKHVLSSIKGFTEGSFPLEDCLVYLEQDEVSPDYLKDPDLFRGKKYCLHEKCDEVTEDGSHPCKEFNPLNVEEWPTAEELKLDQRQHEAFRLALTHKVTVIQGPPGTGKTFIGKKIVKALLQNVPLLPIVICCLTNHALDQFLEGILEHTTNVIRLGSQSKKEALNSYTMDNIILTLRNYKDNDNKVTPLLNSDPIAKKCYNHLRTHMGDLLDTKISGDYDVQFFELKDLCNNLNNDLKSLCGCESKYLEESALNDIIGYKDKKQLISQSSTHSPNLTANILEWLACPRKSDLYSKCKERFEKIKREDKFIPEATNPLWSLNLTQRYELFYLWRKNCISILKKNIDATLEEYKILKGKCTGNMTNYMQVNILKRAHVIGVTTTGASKFRELLSFTNPSILIVEEAAEVLESHIIASLLPTIKHLILIGDHKQLRPLPSSHELAELYNLKISMFERLFMNDVSSATLVYQHRMKPCIADLLVNKFLYEDLKSYPNVYEYEEIKGMKSSVFFFHHTEAESENSSSSSSRNEYEVKMVFALTRYLLSQSYSPENITVLATYAAQVNAIQECFNGEDLEVPVTTVDNYQGEENDIIIVSFVRSNRNGVIGFLKENNRVCVALSRARKGMFCFGNFKLYAEKSPLWNDIVIKLEAQNMIGDEFPLKCARHGTETNVTTNAEILEFIDRGCQEPCNFQLPCGHVCTRKCHYKDAEHLKYECLHPCEKFIDENRKCPRYCFQPCKRAKKATVTLKCGHEGRPTLDNPKPVCLEEVQKRLPCDHLVTVFCSTDVRQFFCKALQNAILSCGHEKKIPCYKSHKLNHVICHELRPLVSPCGHTVDVPCNLNLEGRDLLDYCTKTCGTLLTCRHPCIGDCKFCFDFGIHALCTQKCDQKLICGHQCRGYCGSPCLPCKEKCGLVCPHSESSDSRCINSCYRPCIECRKPCKRRCEHIKCPKRCHEECIVDACTNNCNEILPCGHKCIGLCGDPCPYLCRTCNEADIESGDAKVDRYVMLEDCDHVIEVDTLNKHIDNCLLDFQWPDCPVCSTSIFQSLRFKGQLLHAKRLVFKSYDTTKQLRDVKFFYDTMYNEEGVVPAMFKDMDKGIRHIIDQENLTSNVLLVLKHCILGVRRLVKIHDKLNCSNEDVDQRLQCRFETLMIWIFNHLKGSSIQQLNELDKSIDTFEEIMGIKD